MAGGLATPRQNPTKEMDHACGVDAQGASKVKFSTFPDFFSFLLFQLWLLKQHPHMLYTASTTELHLDLFSAFSPRPRVMVLTCMIQTPRIQPNTCSLRPPCFKKTIRHTNPKSSLVTEAVNVSFKWHKIRHLKEIMMKVSASFL